MSDNTLDQKTPSTTLRDTDLLYKLDVTGEGTDEYIPGSNFKTEVEPSATRIKNLYESNADTNAYTDGEKSKLAAIESGAQVNTVNSVNGETGDVVLDAQDVLPDQTGQSGKYLKTNGTVASWEVLTGGGDMLAATYDPQGIAGDAFDTDNHTDGLTNKVYTATEKTKLAGIEDGAEVNNISDVDASSLTGTVNSNLHYHDSDRNRGNHTGTQLAASISNFDTEVSNNSDVAANTTHRSSDGTDHSFIGQNLTQGATPTFQNLISTNNATQNSHVPRLDQVNSLIAGLNWQESVLNQINFTANEPPTPILGDRYINTASGTSNVTAQAVTLNYIYEWNGVDWTEYIPDEGWTVWDKTADTNYTFNGSSWVEFGSTVSHNNTTGLQGGTVSEYYHLTNAQHTIATQAATSSQNGYATSTQIAKLDGIEAGADNTGGNVKSDAITITIDGNGAVITTGNLNKYPIIPYNCTITGWNIAGDQVGSAVIDLWVRARTSGLPTDTQSITGSTPPTVSAAQTAYSTTLTDWTPSISADSYLGVNVDSCSTFEHLVLTVYITKA